MSFLQNHLGPNAMTKSFPYTFPAALCLVTGAMWCEGPDVTAPSTLARFDGVYDWTITVRGIAGSCSSCVRISNGTISNTENSFSGAEFDSFDNIEFAGKCPNGNSSVGTYSGKSGGLARPQWLGTWTCSDGSAGGSASTWKIFNQK
jgi:hypothetical protein